MDGLSEDDAGIVRAAEGWLELGNYDEAFTELDKLPPQQRTHHSVLGLRYRTYAAAHKWEHALTIAESLTQHMPTRPQVWFWRASAECQLGRLEDARQSATRCFEACDTETSRKWWKIRVLDETLLEAIWSEIQRRLVFE